MHFLKDVDPHFGADWRRERHGEHAISTRGGYRICYFKVLLLIPIDNHPPLFKKQTKKGHPPPSQKRSSYCPLPFAYSVGAHHYVLVTWLTMMCSIANHCATLAMDQVVTQRPRQDESSGQCLQGVRMGPAELFRSVLRTSMRLTSRQAPILACNKTVHFAANLEQARSFFQLDPPNSISTKSFRDHYEDRVCDHKLLYHDGHATRRQAVL